jgi:hypothetical protein
MLLLATGVACSIATGRAGAAESAVITYGYPYARSCPDAGFANAVDRWGMYECNCTSYVAWALRANHRPGVGWFEPFVFDVRQNVSRAGAVFLYVPRRFD